MSISRNYAAWGTLAMAAAIGWNRKKPSTTTSLFPFWDAVLAALGGWWYLQALGNVRIGVQHPLGSIVTCENNDTNIYRRRLGFLERWYVCHSRCGYHTGFQICLDLETAEGNSTVPTLDEIRIILKRVAMRFPWLRVKVKRDGVEGIDSADCLTPTNEQKNSKSSIHKIWGDDLYLETIELPQNSEEMFSVREMVLPGGTNFKEELQKLFAKESARVWHDENPKEPMWRAMLIKSTDKNQLKRFHLLLAFHHLIIDGIGATKVAQAIVEEIGNHSNTKKPDSPVHAPWQLSQPLEDRMDTVPILSYLLKPVLLDRFPSITPYLKPPHWQGLTKQHDPDLSGPRQSQMVCCSILLDSNQLRRTCNKMNVTVNSLCVATLCKAIARVVHRKDDYASVAITKGDNSTNIRFKITVAKNERNACNLSANDLGVYLSGPQVYVTAQCQKSQCTSKHIAFDDCRLIATSFQRNLRASFRAAAMDIGLCPFISEDWIQFARKFSNVEPNGIHDSLEFSNLGKVTFETTSENIKVNGLWFAQGRRESGPAITATMVRNGPSGAGIRAVLSAFPQAVPQSDLNDIVQEWETELRIVLAAS